MFEAAASQAWLCKGLETIKEPAQKRLKGKGWDYVRPALFVTVRSWTMVASSQGHAVQKPQAGFQYFERALDLLEWGRNMYPWLVPPDAHGSGSQVRVSNLSVELTVQQAYHTDPGLNSKFPLEQLKEKAEDPLKETDRLTWNHSKVAVQVDPGFI
ncbi:hypothetical protein AZE42_09879 [Rhizopogon vesiculosus]|uniref:Uncharacterized protein n=1 Tax=Rhizopogon vesiculosus TaxID=180088 RepID=A0A1J8QV58_9AGAM|nr:hypothetical protein AZE42_09879 [Rhizopogon vesiculosus]